MSTLRARPANARQGILALLASLGLFLLAIVAARYHSVVCVPVLVVASLVLLWGARRPAA